MKENKYIPDSDFSDNLEQSKPTPIGINSIWAGTVDKLFGIEIKRVIETAYKGKYTLFEISTGKILHYEEVNVSYGAMFGPDKFDIYYWQNLAGDIVDKYYTDNNIKGDL